jgi:hypothetical protein
MSKSTSFAVSYAALPIGVESRLALKRTRVVSPVGPTLASRCACRGAGAILGLGAQMVG